jgi:DNA invertase Pin-like site-specific DNA recombinase
MKSAAIYARVSTAEQVKGTNARSAGANGRGRRKSEVYDHAA